MFPGVRQIVLPLFVLAFLASCSPSSTPTDKTPAEPADTQTDTDTSGSETSDGTSAAEPVGEATIHVVEVTNFSYSPAKLTLKAGDTVKWVFKSGTHTVTSGTNCTPDGKLDSEVHASPFTFSRTFDTPGRVDYFCAYREHCQRGQVGVLEVEP